MLWPNRNKVSVNLGVQGTISGNYNVCTGSKSITVSGEYDLGVQARLPNPFYAVFQHGRQWFSFNFYHAGSLNEIPIITGHFPKLVNAQPCEMN